MGIFTSWLNSIFNKDKSFEVAYCMTEYRKLQIEALAIDTAINMIASALSLSEFITFDKGKEVKKENYYLFNVEPNLNVSASQFWQKVVSKLVLENEVLIIQNESHLYVVDSFEVYNYAFKENIYKNITIGELALKKTFVESDIFHLKLHNRKIKSVIDSIVRDYDALIEYSKTTYKRSNAKRGVLNIPTNYPQTPQAQAALNKLLGENFKAFFEAEGGAVLPLTNGITYDNLSNQTYKNGSDSRDIRYLIDDIFDFVAIAFHIPPQLLKGTTEDTDKLMNSFITLCVNPIAELIKDEINRKYFGMKNYIAKTYMKVDTSRIKYVDIKEMAMAMDILFRIGVNTINDNLRLLGRQEDDDPQCDERFITKNYDTIESLGGEVD